MFRAHVRSGKLSMAHTTAERFQSWKNAHEGAEVVIAPFKETRTSGMNRLYWAYLTVIAKETGANADDLHAFFKHKFLAPRIVKVRGEEIEVPGSTAKLEKQEFSEYLDKIAALTEIALPTPEEAGYISNYSHVR